MVVPRDRVLTMLEELKADVLEANLETSRSGLVFSTFGNVSGIDRASETVVIKPSGVPYATMTIDDMVVSDLVGKVASNFLKPSSDLGTHLALYQAFPSAGAVVHTHSTFATVFAQARRPIIPLGTTHADYFRGAVPVTRELTDDEVMTDLVGNTGAVIVETFAELDPGQIPAVLVAGHGPFVWGRSPSHAVENAVLLEEIARLAWHTLGLDPTTPPMPESLLDQHYHRKHGVNATYGQQG